MLENWNWWKAWFAANKVLRESPVPPTTTRGRHYNQGGDLTSPYLWTASEASELWRR